MEKIYDIQLRISAELKAPKNLFNKFGNYKYRNVEGICEAVKPLLSKYQACIFLSDEVVEVCERVYVKATAKLISTEDGSSITVTALAREAEDKKGMDYAQITGSSSSYARKYALNGLLLLDDTKDPDTEEYQTRAAAPAPTQVSAPTPKSVKVETDVPTAEDFARINEKLKSEGIDPATVNRLYGTKSISSMNKKQIENVLAHLKEIKQKQEENK